MGKQRSLKVVAIFEACKGVVVLLAASGLLLLVHKDLHEVAAQFIAHLHLNPASRYPKIFLDAAADFNNAHFQLLAFGAVAYSTLRFVEAYGLFHEAAWAELLAALSGGIYLPFEAVNLWQRVTLMSLGALIVNLSIVLLMVASLLRRRKGHENAGKLS